MTNYFIWPVVAAILFSCAKKPEYDAVYKVAEQTNRFKDFDTDSVYVYLPSTLDTPRNVSVKMPFYQDEEVLVKLNWTKEGLSIFAPDEQNKFDFSRNQKPIFTIPGDYKAYRCAKNNLGECTNREEVDYETHWSKRPYFEPKLERIDFSSSLTTMDIRHDDGCIIQKGARLKDYLIKKGVINIELEREFRISSNDSCLSKYLRMDGQKLNTQDFSFKTTYFYSLVRLKDLASPDYEKFNYPLVDQNRFGYFLDIKKSLDPNFSRVKKRYLLNRWNPKREFLTFHLSDSFNGPGKEIFKDATYKAVEDINKMFESVGIKFKVRLEEPSGKKSGDLRYNTIVLITDPLRVGLLGYAPAVTNPITGEIIQGHVNMYSGVTTQIVPIIYDHMVRLSYEEAKIEYKGGESEMEMPLLADAEVGSSEKMRSDIRSKIGFKKPETAGIEDPNLKLNPDYWSATNVIGPPGKMEWKNEIADKIDFFAKNNAYHSDLFLSGGFHKSYMPGIKDIKEIWHENKTLKRWENLTEPQKKKLTNIIAPLVYRYTFIHEFGHGLGLRHNFMGSVDKKNFYKKEDPILNFVGEILKTGENEIKPPQFSSIMDYGYSSLSDLPIFGKYDMAALRYGYARKIEIEKEGKKELVPLGNKGIKLYHIPHLVKYEFCTDENVSADSLCNRFDEGTSYTEIMKHYLTKYEADFFHTNFRNEATKFTIYGNVNYFWGRYGQFDRIRDIFDSWETYFANEIKARNVPKSIEARRGAALEVVKGCENKKDSYCEKINDLHQASTMAGEFFLNILKTPEHICLYLNRGKVFPIALRTLHADFSLIKAPKSCYDKEVSETFKKQGLDKTYTLLGERGRFLTSTRENDPQYKYSSDISARGIWVDKVLAMQFLFGRNLPSHKVDDPEFNFRDHPIIGPKLDDLVGKLFNQSEVTDMPGFFDKLGRPLSGPVFEEHKPLRFNFIDNPEIRPQVSQILNYFLDLPWRSSFFLSRPMITAAENYLQTTSPKIAWLANMDRDFFRVKKVSDHITLNQNIYPQSMSGEDGFIYGASTRNTLADGIIGDLTLEDIIESDQAVISYKEAQARLGSPISTLDVLKQVYGRKNNPNVLHVDRTEAIGFPIKKKLASYVEGMGPDLQMLSTSGGGIVLKKILDMASKKENLELKDFKEAFGPQGGEIFFKYYQNLKINEIAQAYEKINVEINLIHMSLPEIKRTHELAMALKMEGATLESVVPPEEKNKGIKEFIITNSTPEKIMEIHDWLKNTANVPPDFPLSQLYRANLGTLKKIMDIVEFKNREELEYTLKNLPSY